MYKWKIEYILKNGEHLFGEYYGDEGDSGAVIQTLVNGYPDTFNGCKTVDGKGTIAVRNSEIAALIVSV